MNLTARTKNALKRVNEHIEHVYTRETYAITAQAKELQADADKRFDQAYKDLLGRDYVKPAPVPKPRAPRSRKVK